MEKEDGGSERSGGQEFPARAASSGAAGEGQPLGEDGDGPRPVEVTAEEQAAIRQFLNEPGTPGARAGPTWALARPALKFAGVLLLAGGVVVGYADGNEFDEVGCSVAQRPGGASRGAHSAEAAERASGKLPGSEGGAGGGSGGGGPAGRSECEVLAQRCPNQMADGKCRILRRPCRGLEVRSAEFGVRNREVEVQGAEFGVRSERSRGALNAAIEGDPATGHFCIRVAPANERGQPPPAQSAEPDTEPLGIAAKVFELLRALDPGKRLRKAPPITVFLMRFRRNFSLSEIARACDCHKSLVALRLRAIQEKLPWQPQQLRGVSAHVEAMQDALSDPRAKRTYRRGAVYGDGEEDEGVD